MRISVVSALYPPNIIGGAERAAERLNAALISLGHDVSVLTSGTRSQKALFERTIGNAGETIFEAKVKRAYAPINFAHHDNLTKLIWHGQDHVAPHNERVWASFLASTDPDAVIVHCVQGLGFNGLRALGARAVPTLVVAHDYSLACYRTSMFKRGQTCAKHCASCRVSARVKHRWLNALPKSKTAIISPSRSHLDALAGVARLEAFSRHVIANAGPPDTARQGDFEAPRKLLYLGQISTPKGTPFIVGLGEQFERLGVTLTVAGDGPEKDRLIAENRSPAIQFIGQIERERVATLMQEHDCLLVPSLWAENAPLVIDEAMACGLPILASDVGGIGEMIEHERTGVLLPAGDAEAWTNAIDGFLRAPERLREISRRQCELIKHKNAASIAARYLEVMAGLGAPIAAQGRTDDEAA